MKGATHLAVRNWRDFQHYRDRRPPWIKLYSRLLDDYEFGQLSEADKGTLVMIWLLASRHDGVLPNDPAWLTKQANLKGRAAITRLVNGGWLVPCDAEQVASNTQALRDPSAMPETETETETEKDASSSAPASVKGWSDFLAGVTDTYRPAVEAAIRAAGDPDALRRELVGLTLAMGGPAYSPPVVAQALHEMAVGGVKVSPRALRGFCRKIVEGDPVGRIASTTDDPWSREAIARAGEAA